MVHDARSRRIVFCDFDGTITAEETFVAMVRLFARGDHARVSAMAEQGLITQSQAVRLLVQSIPSAALPAMRNWIRSQELRAGFGDLLAFLADCGVPLVVVSGGLLEQVYARLEPYANRIHAIHAARIRVQNSGLRVFSDYEDSGELVSKRRVMALYDWDEAVVIGDGANDIGMAREADLVFARDDLRDGMIAYGQSYLEWRTFEDVWKELCARWTVGQAPPA